MCFPFHGNAPKHKGSLLRGDKSVYDGGMTIEEYAPAYGPMGFRAPPPAPNLIGSFFVESLPDFKVRDVLRLKLANGKEADIVISQIVELTSDLYSVHFNLESEPMSDSLISTRPGSGL